MIHIDLLLIQGETLSAVSRTIKVMTDPKMFYYSLLIRAQQRRESQTKCIHIHIRTLSLSEHLQRMNYISMDLLYLPPSCHISVMSSDLRRTLGFHFLLIKDFINCFSKFMMFVCKDI